MGKKTDTPKAATLNKQSDDAVATADETTSLSIDAPEVISSVEALAEALVDTVDQQGLSIDAVLANAVPPHITGPEFVETARAFNSFLLRAESDGVVGQISEIRSRLSDMIYFVEVRH